MDPIQQPSMSGERPSHCRNGYFEIVKICLRRTRWHHIFLYYVGIRENEICVTVQLDFALLTFWPNAPTDMIEGFCCTQHCHVNHTNRRLQYHLQIAYA